MHIYSSSDFIGLSEFTNFIEHDLVGFNGFIGPLKKD